jgi:hypothetical protein
MPVEKAPFEKVGLGSPCQPGAPRGTDGETGAKSDPRERRILAYHQTALEILDPLAANVAAVTADIMLMEHQVKRILTPALEMAASAPRELANLLPVLDRYLRLTGQIHRYSRFSDHLARQTKAAAEAAAKASEAAKELEGNHLLG